MSNNFSDEKLSAYLDGELSESERATIQSAIQEDSDLRVRLEQMGQADQLWEDVLGLITDKDMPQSVLDMLTEDTDVPTNDNQPLVLKKWLMPVAASLAFFLGLSLQPVLNSETAGFDGVMASGQIAADNPLYSFLENKPSAESVSMGSKTPVQAKSVLTFETVTGEICREFIISTETSASRNVACRDNQQWNILIASRTRPLSENSYQTVGAETDQAVDMLIDTIIAGIPFDRDAEMELISAGWNK